MTVKEILKIIPQSARIQIIREKQPLYVGYAALATPRVHWKEEEAEKILGAEVKRLQSHIDISHKKWKEKGLLPPLEPEETPNYSFSDLQLALYTNIEI